MRRQRQGLGLIVVGAMCIVLLAWLVQPAAGMSPATFPVAGPTLPAREPGQNGGGPSESPGDGGAVRDCTGLSGTVVNWGYRNEPDVMLNLSGGGYEVEQVSGSEGQYEFKGLGQGYAVLRPVLPVVQAQSLYVYADQIAVPLTCGSPAVVNVGLYSGDQRPQPPAHVTVSMAGTADPGTTLTFTITVQNDLPTGISKVMLTDLLPEQLQYVDVEAATGPTMVQDGRMLTWNIGQMANAEAADATLTVRVNPAASAGDLIAHRVSLLYAEAMADQVLTTIAVGQGFSSEQSMPEAGPAIAESGEMTATPTQTPVPASATIELTPTLPVLTGTIPLEGQPAKLPATGAPGGATMPLIGLGLLAVTMATKLWRRG